MYAYENTLVKTLRDVIRTLRAVHVAPTSGKQRPPISHTSRTT